MANLVSCNVSGLAASGDGKVMYVSCAGPLWDPGNANSFSGRAFRIADPASTPIYSDITAGLSGVAWRSLTDVTTNQDGSLAYFSLGGFGEGVFRYEVGGGWTLSDQGLPEVPVNAILYDWEGQSIFAGTDVGVYIKPPHSTGWLNFSKSAPLTLVSDMEIDYSRRKLIASTMGRGVWEACLPEGSSLIAYCRPPIVQIPDFNPSKSVSQPEGSGDLH